MDEINYTYGLDRSYFDGEAINGIDVLAQDVIKRVTTPTDKMWWQPRSIDLTNILYQKINNSEIIALKSTLIDLFSDDPRIDKLEVNIYLYSREIQFIFTVKGIGSEDILEIIYTPGESEIKVRKK